MHWHTIALLLCDSSGSLCWHYHQGCKSWRPLYFQHGCISRDYDQSNVTEEHTHTTPPKSRKYFCLAWHGLLKVSEVEVPWRYAESLLPEVWWFQHFIIAVTIENSAACLADGTWDLGFLRLQKWLTHLCPHASAEWKPWSACRRSAWNFWKTDFTKRMAVGFVIIYSFI